MENGYGIFKMNYENLEHIVLESKENKDKLNDLLEAYKPFIASCTQKVSGKFLQYGIDDELSIAMMAFVQAVKRYLPENGDFLKFAGIIIRNKVIDYYRGQKKHASNLIYLKTDDTETEDVLDIKASMEAFEEEKLKEERLSEIAALKEKLKNYNISFWELENAAPKNKHTRKVCKDVIYLVMNNPILLNEVLHNKSLPLSQIEKKLGINRKKFERHRKYILTVLIIKSGDYPYLSNYIKEV